MGEAPKSNGKVRLLGIPTVTDRLLQQSVYQVIMPLFEVEFTTHSYGFRPNKNAQQAVQQAQQYINAGHRHIVDIDLKSFPPQADGSLYSVAAIVPQSEVSFYNASYPQMVENPDPSERETHQAQEGRASRKSAESSTVQYHIA